MGLILDNFLQPLQEILFHPATPLLFLSANLCFQARACLNGAEQNLPVLGLIWSLAVHIRNALAWAMFFWALQWNRIQNQKSLNPTPALSCNWTKELVVITGGAGGIGGELVKKLEGLGATVAILDLDPPSFKTGDRTYFYRTDVASFENVTQTHENIVAKLGSPTMIAINAAVFRGNTILDATVEDLRCTFSVNILGALFCIKAFLPSMIAAKHGHVLVTSSVKAFITTSNAVGYSASKAALTNIVEGLRTELKHKYGNP
ncbi:epidermal retinol dehydrogenase 2 [Penicillium longicatenatum]|nr:epidermal retinol dehydrogenase 2 [Penicillium longicatenatum]